MSFYQVTRLPDGTLRLLVDMSLINECVDHRRGLIGWFAELSTEETVEVQVCNGYTHSAMENSLLGYLLNLGNMMRTCGPNVAGRLTAKVTSLASGGSLCLILPARKVVMRTAAAIEIEGFTSLNDPEIIGRANGGFAAGFRGMILQACEEHAGLITVSDIASIHEGRTVLISATR